MTSKEITEVLSQLSLTEEQEKPLVDIITIFKQSNADSEEKSIKYSEHFLYNLQNLFKGYDTYKNALSMSSCDFDKFLLEVVRHPTHTGLKYANVNHFMKSGDIYPVFKNNTPELQQLLSSRKCYNKGGVAIIHVDTNSCLNCENFLV